MSNLNYNKTSPKKSLDTVQLKPVIEVKMPESFKDKVKYLCKSIPKEEWSGILLYEPIGTIADIENFHIVLRDIIPLDKGTQAFTSYNNFEELLKYFDEVIDTQPTLEEDYQNGKVLIGHIHSHNTMAVFFSGTDNQELVDNCENHFYYLSLIVNNFMDFCCKIAIHATVDFSTDVPYTAKNELGNSYDLNTTTITYKKEKMLLYDCKITTEKEDIIVPETFMGRVKGIIQKAAETLTAKKKESDVKNNLSKYPTSRTYPTYPTYPALHGRGGLGAEDYDDDPSWPNSSGAHGGQRSTGFTATNIFASLNDEHPTKSHSKSEVGFLMLLLRFGTFVKGDTLYQAFEDIETSEWKSMQIGKSIVENYNAIYDKYYSGEQHDMDSFLDTLSEVIVLMEEHEIKFRFLSSVIPYMKSFEVNMKKAVEKESQFIVPIVHQSDNKFLSKKERKRIENKKKYN